MTKNSRFASHRTNVWAIAVVILLSVASVPMARAQDYTIDDNTLLLPIWIENPVMGGNGSRWESELRVLNVGGGYGDPIRNLGPDCPSVDCGPFGAGMPENVSVAAFFLRGRNIFAKPGAEGNPGALLFLRPGASVAFQLRVRDTSRDADRRGTWVPVIRRNQALATTTHILGIPVDARYRYTFRIYSFLKTASRARVRVYATNPDPMNDEDQPIVPPDHLINEFTVDLFAQEYAFPSYAVFDGLASLVDPAVHREVRLEVEPEGGVPMWSMLSITNNETQEFTLVLPTKN